MEQTQLQTYIAKHTLNDAVAELEKEKASAESAGNKLQVALTWNDLGVVYLLDSRVDEARNALSQAQLGFIALDDPAGQGRATGNLAQLEEQAGNKEQAGALYMQAADLLHEGNAYADEYTTRRRLSRYYMSNGATMMALSENHKALAVKPNANAFDKVQGWLYAVPLRLMGVA